jgi:predicted nuclease of predicted toxin-antitoxin system
MNLTPLWVEVFIREGWPAVHWSTVGDPSASDATIMAWAKENSFVVFTLDLDFGAILAATNASGPSVVQVRAQNVLPDYLADLIGEILRLHQAELDEGALIVLDESNRRVRILPLHR